jgi:hypothetical protein
MNDFSIDGSFAFTKPNNPDEFVQSAVSLSGDRDRVEELARKGRALFESELAGPILIGRVLEAYQQALI